MKKQRVVFCKKHAHWTSEDWKKYCFQMKVPSGGSGELQVSPAARRGVQVRLQVHCENSRAPRKCDGIPRHSHTKRCYRYQEVLQTHLLPFWPIHGCYVFKHDGVLAHRIKKITEFLKEHDKGAGGLATPQT